LLDARLLNKKLDVRIRGTTEKLYHRGVYEGREGFIVPDRVFSNVEDTVQVQIGYAQSRRPFPLKYLVPHMTTQREMFVSPAAARPVISTIGERVVIIGADLNGARDAVGFYAQVINCSYPLPPNHGLVWITSHGASYGQYRYFSEDSLCRSQTDDTNWWQYVH
jgi:hypothetical protein